MTSETFVYVSYIATTPDKVWQALQDGDLMRQYWKHENISDWKVGSHWEMVANDGKRTVKHVGTVLECTPNKRLALSWTNPEDVADTAKTSKVALDIETVGDMVRLTVTHEDLTPEMRSRIGFGWPLVLSSMKSFLETGRSLNF